MAKALDENGLARVWGKIKELVSVLGGATTPEEALANLGGLSMELVWENASPGSSFPEQDLTFARDGSECAVLVTACYGNDSHQTADCQIVPIKPGVATSYEVGTLNIMWQVNVVRSFTVSAGPVILVGIKPGRSYTNYGGTQVENNALCVPLRIYVIKNISPEV